MNCPWCGGNEIKHDTMQTITAPYIVAQLGGGSLPMATVSLFSECKCGLIFQEHRQSDEWYNWFYESGTYRQTLGISQEEMDADERRRAREIIDWLPVDTILTHFDIGSSRGFLVDEISKKYKCLGYAFDLNKEYQLGIRNDSIYNSCDFLSAIHVLEHSTSPLKMLYDCAKLTNKHLLIEVPGKNTIGGPLRFAHLYYFPPELLKDKLIELGFNILAMETEPNTRILTIKK